MSIGETNNFPKLIDCAEQLETIRTTDLSRKKLYTVWANRTFENVCLEKVAKIANSEVFKPFASPIVSKLEKIKKLDDTQNYKVVAEYLKEMKELNALIAEITHGILQIPAEEDEKVTSEIFKNLHITQELIEKKKFAEIAAKLGKEIPKSKAIEVLLEPYSKELLQVEKDNSAKAQEAEKNKAIKVQEAFDLKKLLKMPGVLRELILNSLPNEELKKMEIALAKQKNIPQAEKSGLEHLEKILRQISDKRIFQEIVNDHLKWKRIIDSWQNVSLEDKIWLIRLYELHSLGIKIPQMDELHRPDLHIAPREFSPKLLEKKNEIEKVLAGLKVFRINIKKIDKCPTSICLLRNLEELRIVSTSITQPPDLRHFPNLRVLALLNNKLVEPPDVRWNPKLEEISLVGNQLKQGPDLSKNPNVEVLLLGLNKIETPPNYKQTHPKLEVHL